MHKKRRILAIVPARKGSVGLPGKNLKPLLGKPLIAWTINEALKSRYLDRVIVTTDDNRIAAISKKYKAQVPFLRPKRLATSNAKMSDVVLHALDFLGKNKDNFDFFVLLQPTSPLRKASDIDNSISLFFKRRAKTLVSVCRTEHSPYWCSILSKNSRIKEYFGKKLAGKNRQDLPIFYRVNGAVYVCDSGYFRKTKSFIDKNTFVYRMKNTRSVDIDTLFDFKIAECLLSKSVRYGRAKR